MDKLKLLPFLFFVTSCGTDLPFIAEKPHKNAHLPPIDARYQQAQYGDAEQQYQLGLDHLNMPTLTDAHIQAGKHWLVQAANQQHPEALFALAMHFEIGTFAKDPQLADDYLYQAAKLNHIEARYLYAVKLLDPEHPLYNVEEAENLLQLNHEHRHLSSSYLLATHYLRQSAQDLALPYLKKAAQSGLVHAQYAYGKILMDTHPGEGREWLEKAALQNDTLALYELGLMHLYGRYQTPRNIAKAQTHLEKALQLGEITAHYALGKTFEKQNNLEKALKHYRQAAHFQDPNGMFALAVWFDAGKYSPKDLPTAARWYREAAQLGHANAQFNLASMYVNGEGLESSLPDAWHWLEQAHHNGHPNAASVLEKIKPLIQTDPAS